MKHLLRALTSALLFVWATLPIFGQNAAKPPVPGIVVGPEKVQVRVSVTDPLNRQISGLRSENFRILEDGAPQTITDFQAQATPLSLGVIFDLNGAMRNRIGSVIETIRRLRSTGLPQDEYFLVPFNTALFGQQDNSLTLLSENEASFSLPDRDAALRNAISVGLDRLMKGKNGKKVLLFITGTKVSRRLPSPWETWEFAKQAEVQVYSISELSFPMLAPIPLVRTSEVREFFPGSSGDLGYYVELTRAEVRNQYVLGYSPTNRLHDGKWRKIEVRLNPLPGLPTPTITVRPGYYAPRD